MDAQTIVARKLYNNIVFLKFAFVTVILTGFIYTPVYAQEITSREGIALQNQILELRQTLGQMQESLDNMPTSSNVHSSRPLSSGDSDLLSQLLDRVNSLEQHQRDMRGEIDQ
ncbi:MAG: hypothetical protein J6P38_07105, partial [Acetobacter sp.]|nr:hypothetical protein [Acetobacter sp.]